MKTTSKVKTELERYNTFIPGNRLLKLSNSLPFVPSLFGDLLKTIQTTTVGVTTTNEND